MDSQRFDQLARRLAAATSRRQVLKSLAAGLAATVVRPTVGGAQGGRGNSDCAHFCTSVFAPGQARGQCTSDAAHGQGLCPACDADASRVCFAPNGVASCPDRGTDPANCGGCNVPCPSGACVAGACLKANGEACGAGGECVSGFCVDGVCCDGACGGQCEVCTTGACLPISGPPIGDRPACTSEGSVCGGACDGTNGAACAYPDATAACGDPVCRAGDAVNAACNGAGGCVERTTDCGLFVCRAGACLTTCAVHEDCLGQAYCAAGVCTADKVAGQPCAGRDECQSGFCADGVCCDTACAGQCEACTTGTCLPTSGPPIGGRIACASDGSVCGGVCGGVDPTACVYPGASVACAAGDCRDGDAIPFVCDGGGACVEAPPDECGLFVCRDGACLDACGDDDDCLGQAYCAGGVCAADKAAGQACGGRDECASGSCADGVCCNDPCAGQCEACNLAGSVGTCIPVTGAPVGERAVCGGTGVCVGACDGAERAACIFPGSTVACDTTVCRDGDAVSFACDSAGTCAESVDECGPYLCRDGACLETCATTLDCVAGGACFAGSVVGSPTNVCRVGKGTGAACTSADECLSPRCYGGVCCNRDCPTDPNGTTTCPGGEGCAFSCNAGYKLCVDRCIPTAECCPQTENCAVSCGPGQPGTVCNGFCVDTSTNPNHCGACDKPCFDGTCVGGLCRCGSLVGGFEFCLEGESCFGGTCSCCEVVCRTPAGGGPPVCSRGDCLADQCNYGETCDYVTGPACRCTAEGYGCGGDAVCYQQTCCPNCPDDESPVVVPGNSPPCTCGCGGGPACGIRGRCVDGQCRCGDGAGCAADERCSFGHCCPAELTFCDGQCRDTTDEPTMCGYCDTNCGADATCFNGYCVCSPGAAPCPAFERCVDGTCICNRPSDGTFGSGTCGTGRFCGPSGFCSGESHPTLSSIGRRL